MNRTVVGNVESRIRKAQDDAAREYESARRHYALGRYRACSACQVMGETLSRRARAMYAAEYPGEMRALHSDPSPLPFDTRSRLVRHFDLYSETMERFERSIDEHNRANMRRMYGGEK